MNDLQWRILNEIPPIGRSISHVELSARLSDKFRDTLAEKVFSRKVIRQMTTLCAAIPELAMRKEEQLHLLGWKDEVAKTQLIRNISDKSSKMGVQEILGFGVLQEIGTDLLPRFTLAALRPYFAAARERAAQAIEDAERGGADTDPYPTTVDLAKVKAWLKKIRRMPETLTFLKAQIFPSVELTIHKALLFEQLVEIRHDREAQPIVVSPRALVQRGARTYLYAQKRGSEECEPFGLHKIRAARLTLGDFVPAAPNFDIDEVLRGGISDPFYPREELGKTINLEMWIDDGTNRWISVTPLAKDQITTKCDSGYILNAKIPLSEELVWWILSMSYHVKVIEPPILLERVRDDARKMANLYKKVASPP